MQALRWRAQNLSQSGRLHGHPDYEDGQRMRGARWRRHSMNQ